MENQELSTLSLYAAKSISTKGRKIEEQKCPIRTDFQRDRDRIIHSKAFRRLMHKTQVFISPEGDHYRTRLTHTLEVSQISRTISKVLRLNEDLTEAIALGHDLGHTPFGHTGEDALDAILDGGFVHNEQSVRVVNRLENNGLGLNLTEEVQDGIYCHRGGLQPKTLEGWVVQISDKIAYINHDIDDAIRAKQLDPKNLPTDAIKLLGESSQQRINVLIANIIENSFDKNQVTLDEDYRKALYSLRQYMLDNVYESQLQQAERNKIASLIAGLYHYYHEDINKLPPFFLKLISEGETINRTICDYIAGMTDRFAMKLYIDIFVPHSWNM